MTQDSPRQRPDTDPDDVLRRMASWAMASVEGVACIVLGVFSGYFLYAGETRLDTLLAVTFGLGAITFALSVWRRWRSMRQ